MAGSLLSEVKGQEQRRPRPLPVSPTMSELILLTPAAQQMEANYERSPIRKRRWKETETWSSRQGRVIIIISGTLHRVVNGNISVVAVSNTVAVK